MEQPGRILLAEEEEGFRILTKYMLERAGFSVQTAKNGPEVLQSVKQRVPDLILMDWWMLDTDGLQCTRKVREDLGLSEVIILAVTAGSKRWDRDRVLSTGCNDYYSKPISSVYLVAEVKRHLEQRALRYAAAPVQVGCA